MQRKINASLGDCGGAEIGDAHQLNGYSAEPQHYVFFLVENFSHIAFSCAVEPLRIANLISGKELYKWSFASEDGESAVSSNGAITITHGGFEPLDPGDNLFVVSGLHVQKYVTPNLLAYLRRERSKGTQIGAICSATYILAKAGMLDNLRAAIHWDFHDAFEEEFPKIDLSPYVFVYDERVITASGGTAAGDLMLRIIEEEHGIDLSVEVADQMVYNTVRNEDAKQRISMQARHGIRIPHLALAVKLMSERIEEPISLSDIASEIGISTRQLQRLFIRYLKTTPKQYFIDIRLDKARNLLLQTEKPITEISMACGFGTPSSFSRVFRNKFGSTPTNHRTSYNESVSS